MPSRRSVSACFNLEASVVARDRESSRSCSASTDAMSPDCGCVPGSLPQPRHLRQWWRADTLGFDRRHASGDFRRCSCAGSRRNVPAFLNFRAPSDSRGRLPASVVAEQRDQRLNRSRRSRRPSGRGSGSALRGSSTGARRAAELPTKSGCDPTLHRHGQHADSAQQPDRCHANYREDVGRKTRPPLRR